MKYAWENRLALVILEDSGPSIRRVEWEEGAESVTVDGNNCFHRVCQTDWMGFHDWLRGAEGRETIVGFRILFIDMLCDAAQWAERIHFLGLPYVEFEPPFILEVFHGKVRAYDARRSDDQSFLLNTLVTNERGEYALILDTEALSPAERAHLFSASDLLP